MTAILTSIRPNGIIGLLAAVLIGLWLAPQQTPLSAASSCASSSPSSGAYTVTVCITGPADGSTVSGNTAVTASVSVTGTNPGVQQLQYSLDGQYLLTDYVSPYSFSLPTYKFVDGVHSLFVQAIMRDGFVSQGPTVGLTFSNGVTTPPVNNGTFTIATGTTPAAGSPYVLAAVGDGASGEPSEVSVVNLIGSWNPNLFLYLGDVYEKGSPSEFYNWYAPSNMYGKFQSITNPTVGNHEYSFGAGAPGYFDYWNNIPHYYSFNVNGWHVISLDSTSQYNQTSSGTPQYNWLAQDLAANAGSCIITYYHHPVFNIGPEGDSPRLDPIWSLLAQSGVALVLNGHDHDYQRWVPLNGSGNPSSTGVTEFVVGTGGHGTQQFVRSDTRVAVSYTNAMAFGALRLVLNANGASFSFVNFLGTVLDSGVVPCNAAAPDTTPPTTPTGLTANAVAANQVNLSWSPSSDNTGVAGYTVYRNGAQLATTASGVVNYADTSTAPYTTYSYTVDAFDMAGNHSQQSSPASATTSGTYAFAAAADAYVNQLYPTTNYGTAATLKEDASPDIHSYIQFNLQGISGPITKATLRLYANNTSPAGYQVRGVSDNTWTETGITYSNMPAMAATATGSSGGITSGTWSSVDVTSLVSGNGLISFGVTTASGTQFNLASRETGSTGPQLIIQVGQTATPTPTATATATATATPTMTSTPANTPTNTPTSAATATATATPTNAATATATSTATNTPQATATNTPTGTNTPQPTATNTPIPTATNTPLPTATNTPLPTATNTPLPTPTNTPAPTNTPTPTPTSMPSSTTTTFIDVADSYVNSSYPNTNYGTSTSIRTDASPVMNSYLKFTMSNLSGTVKKAILRVYTNSSSSTGYQVRSVADNTWGETTITYSNAPAFSSTVTGQSGTLASGTWTSVDVTSLVTGNGTYSFALTSTGAQINLASRESGANAPQLVITTQ